VAALELYYDFSSTNAYFAAFMAPRLCERLGAELRWQPYHLGQVFRKRDHSVLRDHSPEKLDYLWRDHQRWSRHTGLPFNRPSRFPIKTSIALRGSLVARELGREQAYVQAVMSAYWVGDRDIASAEVIADVASGAGLNGTSLVRRAEAEETRRELVRITDAGIARGVFGAPMFFVGDEMYWGKDRLDFVEEALRKELETERC
jgi:2-hydroxychromene-2-carboxylate isomerase